MATLLVATQIGGCISCEVEPDDPSDAQVRRVIDAAEAAERALDRRSEPDCRSARLFLTRAVTEHATWKNPSYAGWNLRLASLRQRLDRECGTSGPSTDPTPPGAAAPAPPGTSTRRTRTSTATGTAPVPAPTVEAPPVVTPTSEQEMPPAEPEPESSEEAPVE